MIKIIAPVTPIIPALFVTKSSSSIFDDDHLIICMMIILMTKDPNDDVCSLSPPFSKNCESFETEISHSDINETWNHEFETVLNLFKFYTKIRLHNFASSEDCWKMVGW